MAREIRLHDTRTGRKLPLEPRDPGRVGIYSCGPTVYNRIHIGNARPFVVPSLFEGSAVVTYEALACGLPSVVTPGAGSVVRDEVEGLLVNAR